MTDTLQTAVDAVQTYYASDDKMITPADHPAVAVPYSSSLVATQRAVDEALKDGHPLPLIAARAQIRQLWLAQFVTDEDAYLRALAAARHDAERYRDQVIETQRIAALRTVGQGRLKGVVADRLGVSRVTLNKWLAEG